MKYLTYLLSALLLVFAAGCNDTEEPLGDPVPPFTLKADRTTVGVGEPVTFTVTSSDGQDVTADCRDLLRYQLFSGQYPYVEYGRNLCRRGPLPDRRPRESRRNRRCEYRDHHRHGRGDRLHARSRPGGGERGRDGRLYRHLVRRA